MNRSTIKSILFSALYGMAILNSGAASCSKEQKLSREEIKKEIQKGLEKGLEEGLKEVVDNASPSLGLQKKDVDNAIKIMYGKLSENEPNVSEWARYMGIKSKKILKSYKQFISGEITEDELYMSPDIKEKVLKAKRLLEEAN